MTKQEFAAHLVTYVLSKRNRCLASSTSCVDCTISAKKYLSNQIYCVASTLDIEKDFLYSPQSVKEQIDKLLSCYPELQI